MIARDGEIRPVHLEQQLPLGMFGDDRYEIQQFQLEPGDRLLVVSDGVHAATPGGRAPYGESALLTALRRTRLQPRHRGGRYGDARPARVSRGHGSGRRRGHRLPRLAALTGVDPGSRRAVTSIGRTAQSSSTKRTGMERVTDVAAAVESTVESLLGVLESARLAQSPAVPPAQLRVLTIVAASRHTNMSRLAEALDVVPSSASRLCDRLEATGLLRRVPDPRDRREVRLLLTPAARRLLDELRERRRRGAGRGARADDPGRPAGAGPRAGGVRQPRPTATATTADGLRTA